MSVHRTVYGKTALILSVLFLAIAAVTVPWTLFLTRSYIEEANQKLNHDLARYLVSSEFSGPEVSLDGDSLKRSFDILMSINPNIELYLLDPTGRVVAYSAPPGRQVARSIDLGPVKAYLSEGAGIPIRGQDPRHPGHRKVFSAAPIPLEGPPRGYLYIILSGEEHDSVLNMLQTSYVLRLSIWVWASALIFLFVTGLVLFNKLTRRHRKLAAVMESFHDSDFREPVDLDGLRPSGSEDEVDRLGAIFCRMSGRIMEQISELERADGKRRELLGNLSHDLKMPLAALRGHLETIMLKEGYLDREEVKRRLDLALRHTDRLGSLISELLELAKLDSEAAQINAEPFPAAELFQDLVQEVRAHAQEKGVEVKLIKADRMPPVVADMGMLEKLMRNLLDNAVRYTPAGGRVEVRLVPEEAGLGVEITDSGIGISPEDLPHIFERFYRGRDAEGQAGPGTGLGLAIALRIAELHGSRITVKSEPGKGSTFAFRLPV